MSYGMTELSTNTVAALVNGIVVTDMTLSSFLYRHVKTIT